jgi:hypothetical protein
MAIPDSSEAFQNEAEPENGITGCAAILAVWRIPFSERSQTKMIDLDHIDRRLLAILQA